MQNLPLHVQAFMNNYNRAMITPEQIAAIQAQQQGINPNAIASSNQSDYDPYNFPLGGLAKFYNNVYNLAPQKVKNAMNKVDNRLYNALDGASEWIDTNINPSNGQILFKY